jgi:hypothetical protein
VGDGNFELKLALMNMVQANLFSGKPNQDANAHLQHFLEVCRSFTICGVTDDAIRLRLFPFVVWTSLGPLLRWVPGPTTRWVPRTTRLALHGT